MVQLCTAWFRCCPVLVQVWVGVCVSRCVWSSVVIQLCMAQFSCDSGVCMCVYVHWCGSVVCGIVNLWFSVGSFVVQLGEAVWLVQCCGSVVYGMVQRWCSMCSVVVQMCGGVCVQICVVQGFGSVVCGVVHTWFSCGSVAVQMYVYVCVVG